MKKVKTGLIILLAVVLAAGLGVGGINLFYRIKCNEFYRSSDTEFMIPGLSDGFVPRGLSFDENSGYYLVSGYMSDNSASRVYTVDPKTSDYFYLELWTDKGAPDNIHADGITVYGRYVFITTGTENVNIYRLSDVTDSDASAVSPFAVFKAGNRPKSIAVSGDSIYLSEINAPPAYQADPSHRVETESGEKLNAVMLMYDVTELIRTLSAGGPADELKPLAAYAVPDDCQGVCVLKGGQLCASFSNGFHLSKVRIYDDPLKVNLTSDGSFSASDGEAVPYYYMDSDSLLNEYSLPPMAGEVYTQGDEVAVLGESASNKHMIGKITGGRECRSFIPEF